MTKRTKVKPVETKPQTKAAPAASAGAVKPGVAAQKTAAAPTPPARPSKIKILKPETKYRGAREAWFAQLKEFDGKTEGEYLQAMKDKPPALTKNGTPENPTGWVRFFVRTGVMSLQQ